MKIEEAQERCRKLANRLLVDSAVGENTCYESAEKFKDAEAIRTILESSEGATLIVEERQRQISEEGYSKEGDQRYKDYQIARAAITYLFYYVGWECKRDEEKLWPWRKEFWKPYSPLRNLVRAGALIAAEIDRLQEQERRRR